MYIFLNNILFRISTLFIIIKIEKEKEKKGKYIKKFFLKII